MREMKVKVKKMEETDELNEKAKQVVSQWRLIDGSKLLWYEDAAKYYKKVHPKKFGAVDAVLLLLGVFADKPIRGKTMMMKQAFLLEKEVLKDDLQSLQFVGHKYGPHSFLLENTLKNMEFTGLIERQGRGTYSKYFITEAGMKKAKLALAELGEKIHLLKKSRVSWDEMGIDGILKFVYSRYPEYTDSSVIKYRYRLVKWRPKNK